MSTLRLYCLLILLGIAFAGVVSAGDLRPAFTPGVEALQVRLGLTLAGLVAAGVLSFIEVRK